MNKGGHSDIRAFGNWVNAKSISAALKCLLVFLMSQCPNDLMSQSDALAVVDTSTTIDTLNPPTPSKEECYNRGLALYNEEKYAASILVLDTCLNIDSTFNEARLLRGMSYEKKGDWKNAIADYEYLKARNTYGDLLDRRINFYCISVILSRNWYYMIAMMLVVILLMAVAVKSLSYRRG
jgi:tetratricopeptide (TPR) repeat protein